MLLKEKFHQIKDSCMLHKVSEISRAALIGRVTADQLLKDAIFIIHVHSFIHYSSCNPGSYPKLFIKRLFYNPGHA